MAPLDYHRPRTLDEAWGLVERNQGARFVAGGTDVLVKMRQKRLSASALVSLRHVTELRGIGADRGWRIGAATPLCDLLEHAGLAARVPVLADAIASMGSVQIRSVATLGGNLCNASPCADGVPPLLVLDARVRLCGPERGREVPLEEFFAGPGAIRAARAEVLTDVLFDDPPPSTRAVFLKKSRVSMDLAIANVAVRLDVEGSRCRRARVAVGAVAPTPLRLRAVEALLERERLDRDVVAEARRLAMEGIAPITDVRASADYRRAVVGAFVARAVERLMEGRLS